jgi:hypothetical protein
MRSSVRPLEPGDNASFDAAGVAAIVGVSPRTVQKHLENVYVKLGVENRTAAAMRAAAATRNPSTPQVSEPVPKPAGATTEI